MLRSQRNILNHGAAKLVARHLSLKTSPPFLLPPFHVIRNTDEQSLDVYARLTEAQLRNKLEPEKGLFICESPKVIRVALDAGCEPLSLLCEHRHIEGDAADIVARLPDNVPVYTGTREVLATLTGYALTRGVLCAMRRPAPVAPDNIVRTAERIAVLHGVVEATNIGAIFRSAAALGIDGILLTPDTCDPLCRRAVRVSMGSVFLGPWAYCKTTPYPALLHSFGFKTACMALTDNSRPLDDPTLRAEPRLAFVLGTEGDGLPAEAIANADYVVRIPMQHGVDSLNVAAASAVAFWELRAK